MLAVWPTLRTYHRWSRIGSMKGLKMPWTKNTKPVESQTRHEQGSKHPDAGHKAYSEKLFQALGENLRKNAK